VTPQRRRWYAVGGGSAGALAIAATIMISLWGGPDTYTPAQRSNSAANILLWLYAPRDMGRLPSRTDWCTGSAHCWLAQEAAGATQLADATGGWTLAATGTPRTGVYTGLPVEDATGWVDFSSELSTHTDGQAASGTGSWVLAAQTQSATNLVSVSAIIMPVYRQATARVLYSHRATATTTGFEAGVATDGTLYMTVESSAATTLTVKTAATWDDGAWHDVVFRLDGRTANAGRIYVDGAEAQAASPTLFTGGTWAFASGPVTLGADAAGANVWPGGIARLRVAIEAAVPTGSLWGFDPQSDAKVVAADIAWTQSGSVRCFRISATQAFCGAGGKPTYTVSSALLAARPSSGVGWAVEPTRRNFMIKNHGICGANLWLSGGAPATATCYSAVSPSGAKDGSSIVGSNTKGIYRTQGAYTAGGTVYPRFWVRCSSGTLITQTAVNAESGQWSINCATVGGVWAEMTPTHPAVTVNYAWKASGTGLVGQTFYSGTGSNIAADLWLPSITEVDGNSVIYTQEVYAPTGTISWTVDNAPPAYYSGSCGKLQLAGDWASGGCLDIYNGATNAGRQGIDGAHWHMWNSDATEIGTANLVPSGVDVIQTRWSSAAALAPLTRYAVVLRAGAAATWDASPMAIWTPASPPAIHLDGYGTTSCRAVIQDLKIWDKP
jgi:hypothetical protein